MKEHTKAYMAGLMDAEGTITLITSEREWGENIQARLTLTNTHQPLRKWLTDNFGGSCHGRKTQEQPHHLPRFDWQSESYEHGLEILNLLMPYFWVKKEEALVLKEFYEMNGEHNSSKRKELRDRIQALKNRASLTTETPSFPKPNLENAYFAGIFDGEGCIDMGAKNHSLRITVNHTVQPLVKYFHNLHGGHYTPMKKYNPEWSDMWHWELGNQRKIEQILLNWMPYFQIETEQAKIGLEVSRMWHKKDPQKRLVLSQQLHFLNVELGKKIQSELHG